MSSLNRFHYESPDGKRFYFDSMIQEHGNIGMPPVKYIEDSGAQQSGVNIRDWRINPRKINLKLFMSGRSKYQTRGEMLADLIDVIRPNRGANNTEAGWLRFYNDNYKMMEIPATVLSDPSGQFNYGADIGKNQVDDNILFYCPDPIWREVEQNTILVDQSNWGDSCLCRDSFSTEPTTETFIGGSGSGTGISFVSVSPSSIYDEVTQFSFHFRNLGDDQCNSFEIAQIGTPSNFILVNYTLPIGQVVRIDVNNGTITAAVNETTATNIIANIDVSSNPPTSIVTGSTTQFRGQEWNEDGSPEPSVRLDVTVSLTATIEGCWAEPIRTTLQSLTSEVSYTVGANGEVKDYEIELVAIGSDVIDPYVYIEEEPTKYLSLEGWTLPAGETVRIRIRPNGWTEVTYNTYQADDPTPYIVSTMTTLDGGILYNFIADPSVAIIRLYTIETEVSTITSCLTNDDTNPFCLTMNYTLMQRIPVQYNGTWNGDQLDIKITGSVSQPIIQNLTTNKTIQLNYNIPVGEYVIITIRPEYATVEDSNGNDLIGTVESISDLVDFQLVTRGKISTTGENIIIISGTDADFEQSEIQVDYYTRHISAYGNPEID